MKARSECFSEGGGRAAGSQSWGGAKPTAQCWTQEPFSAGMVPAA
jgi:hypothetical protein